MENKNYIFTIVIALMALVIGALAFMVFSKNSKPESTNYPPITEGSTVPPIQGGGQNNNPREPRGEITGDKVNLRSDHSITSKVISSMRLGQSVTILDKYRPSGNSNEGKLRRQTKFYDQNWYFKQNLKADLAVNVIDSYYDGYYHISFKHKDGYTEDGYVERGSLDFIDGDLWYFVRLDSGKEGWILGEFIREQ
ncbi:MAG: hypothetical protein FGM46_01450 [Ferruginibacter sp.]|nr:hypothetical protein [Ferruginibacter sp.]